jgi:DMSO/TMAO reductase YedYZ molybdopterin-dependent catalytic subunit
LLFGARIEQISLRARSYLVRSCFAAALTLLSTLSLAQPKATNQSEPTLRITGKVDRPLVLRAADLRVMHRERASVTDDRGAHVTYEGVPVVELLRRAGAPLGNRLRGSK